MEKCKDGCVADEPRSEHENIRGPLDKGICPFPNHCPYSSEFIESD